jgi:hypothetical protein
MFLEVAYFAINNDTCGSKMLSAQRHETTVYGIDVGLRLRDEHHCISWD